GGFIFHVGTRTWQAFPHDPAPFAETGFEWGSPSDDGNNLVFIRHQDVGIGSARVDTDLDDWCVPSWMFFLLFSIYPTLYLINRIRIKSTPIFACQKCSYDLRAHKAGDKCPECGRLISPSEAAIMQPDKKGRV